MAAKYRLRRSTDGQYNVKSGNGEIILTSERYTAKASALRGIEPVQTKSPSDAPYDRTTSKANQP